MIPRVLVIAGSDSGGGAGIQADVKTIAMLGGHAMTAVTAVTAQNTRQVVEVMTVPPELVLRQIDMVWDDIGVDAVKIGMIGSSATASAVADRLSARRAAKPDLPIVFDPVMVSTSGAALADTETIGAFRRLMDLATVTTPNMPELARLTGGGDEPVAAALRLVSQHRCAVLVKGGHEEGGDQIVDALIEEDNMTSWQGSRIETRHTHGTGCTLASAVAVFLAHGASLPAAVDRAREFVRLALSDAPGLGGGHGPLGHARVRLDCGEAPRLNQVTVACANYAESVAFYRRLGLRLIVDSPPDYARFEAAGGATLSIKRVDDGEPGETTIYLESENLYVEVERLARGGLRFEHGPIQQSWLWREARLRDPFGNMVCLYKAGEARRHPPWRVRA